MKVKRITIEVELEQHDIQSHSTVFEFEKGMWIGNSTMYSRLLPALHNNLADS